MGDRTKRCSEKESGPEEPVRNRKKANSLGDNQYSALKFMASGVRKIFRLRGYQLTCAISWEWKW